jgi:hypothetical protein
MSSIQGQCLCGAVTFEVREPQMLLECHCGRCRTWTGCASTPAVVVSGSNLEQTTGHDQVSCYKEDGFSARYFCARCGTSLWSGGPDPYYVTAGVLEDPALEVACHIQVANKAAWHQIGGEAPQYANFPG